MKRKVNLAIVGISQRGSGLLKLLLEMDDVNIVGVCDLYEDRTAAAAKAVVEAGRPAPVATNDYRRLLDLKKLDAVLTPSSWTSHAQILLDTMESGRYAATEVGGATSIQQCWDLVRTSERTGMPCMMLENCCYGRPEMTVLKMIKEGLFGECVHAEGGDRHDLRQEICSGKENRHYRLANYTCRTGDVYTTHELGPIAKYFNINRGNRMVTLCSVASKSVGLNEWSRQHRGADDEVTHRRFNMGDVITTIIKCANGETITLTHDTSLPRPYSRGNLLEGSRGIWSEDKDGVFIEGVSKANGEWEHWQPMEEIYERFEHPLWQEFRQEGVKGGHGGMDWLVLRGFIEAVKKGTQTPIDVYDTAAWMAITPLSEDSCHMGGMPVAIPDFTDGKWIDPRPIVRSKYCLDAFCEECF